MQSGKTRRNVPRLSASEFCRIACCGTIFGIFHAPYHAEFHARPAACAPSSIHLSREIFMFKRSLVASALLACAFITTAQATGGNFRDRDDPAVIREWNALAEGVIPTSAGPTLPRTYAMMHIAMFDAVNSIEGNYTPYRVSVPAYRFASGEAAAAQAAHDVLAALLPAGTAGYDAALAARLATIHPTRALCSAR